MGNETNSNHSEKCKDLAEAGRYQEALECMQEQLRVTPDDPEVLNDAGTILHCLGRSDEAISHLLKARSLRKGSGQILWNLAEIYLASGKAEQAVQLFDDMERTGVFNVDILNRACDVFINQNDKANAIEMLLRSLEMIPEQRVLEPMIDIIRSKRPKIAFFCGWDGMTFLNEIVDFAKQRFEVRLFEGKTEEDMCELMEWSDISWFEWCAQLAVAASNVPKMCKNVIRLHRYEAYLQWPEQVNWGNIDVLVTVGNKVTVDHLLARLPDLQSTTELLSIPNGVNLDKFKFVDRQPGKNLAFLANLRMVKNPVFVLQCMQKLHYLDPEYRLFFGGKFQDQVLEQYMRQMVEELDLGEAVFFEGWQEDVGSWLRDKHFIVSTSICEGHPVGILEGMACGLKPVIHNFLGARQVFPPEFLFNISEEFCEQILSGPYEPRRYREFVEERYSLKEHLSKINDIFIRFEAEIDQMAGQNATYTGLPAELSAPVFGRD